MSGKSPSLEALRQEGMRSAEMALMPTERNNPGVYVDEQWWVGFWRPRCNLLDRHSERRLPLLDYGGETVGKALICSRCWEVLDKDV